TRLESEHGPEGSIKNPLRLSCALSFQTSGLPGTVAVQSMVKKSEQGEEDEYESDDTPISVRRSIRNKVLPTRLVDYQLNVHELMLTLDEEPRNYNEAKLKPQWLKAMKMELDSIVKNNTWKLVSLPKDASTFVQLCLYYNFYSKYGTSALSKFSPDTELLLYPFQDKLTSGDKSLDLSAFKLSCLFSSLLSSGSSSCWRSYGAQ
ncbi:hypothetical protein Tco_1442732, partial [Tanacetum coccineum]